MKKIEYLGFFVSMALLGGVCVTLYPRRVAIATEDTLTKTAKKYVQKELLKIMIYLDDAKKAANSKTKEKLILKAKKGLKKAERTTEFAQQLVDNAAKDESEMMQEAQKTGMKKALMYKTQEAKDRLQEIKQIVDRAQWLIQQSTLKPAVVTKKKKITSELEELI